MVCVDVMLAWNPSSKTLLGFSRFKTTSCTMFIDCLWQTRVSPQTSFYQSSVGSDFGSSSLLLWFQIMSRMHSQKRQNATYKFKNVTSFCRRQYKHNPSISQHCLCAIEDSFGKKNQTLQIVAKTTLIFFCYSGHDWIKMPVVAQKSHNQNSVACFSACALPT